MSESAVSVAQDLLGRSYYLPDRGVIGEAVAVATTGLTTVTVAGQQEEDVAGAVVLPRLGESVWIAEGRETPLHGRWIGLRTPLVAGEPVTARVLCAGAMVEHTAQARVFDARVTRMVAGEDGPASPRSGLHAVAQLAAMLDQQEVQHARWKAEFAEAAGRRATDMDLCGQFDDFMREWNLPGRTRSYTVLVDTSQLVRLTVEAESELDAEELVTDAMVREARSADANRADANRADALTWSVSRIDLED
ncbi:hypothetical protein SAMN05661080_04139 [Modestobacter sp. DSM 44400]|uniref:hypothetical protein n=1 Tax=Modestobacter sp. DSM 44400 TaxID=1550230 RepID=UPI000894E5EB|nr:hypothetical protein [Modestobacter sp. DSM 44400]SDY64056.1 hypothetical protein SAMN05661080_04139 [Modestobacter sp. DSM 44400]